MDLSKPIFTLFFRPTPAPLDWQHRIRHRLYEAGQEDEELFRLEQERACMRRRGYFEVKDWW